MKSQTKTRWDWRNLTGSVCLFLVVMGIFVLWDPLRLVPTLSARVNLEGVNFPAGASAAITYGLGIMALGVVGLVFIRPPWLQNRVQQVIRFCQEAWAELKKVQWPTWSEVWTYTVVVLTAIIAVAIYIGFWDWIFTQILYFLIA